MELDENTYVRSNRNDDSSYISVRYSCKSWNTHEPRMTWSGATARTTFKLPQPPLSHIGKVAFRIYMFHSLAFILISGGRIQCGLD
jgi:hypothetical protein